ncbi:MAG: hypothetical protein COY72_01415 [Candidatus Nealsonbacteria bacterium CG_4_10_14_0_8_um_filter_35_10]|uniref:Uncharacterized protein n=2 Tax=Candidatus Nealsoniibacteriota TaxID=1817911 RepID=A0A2M7R8B1_9BACT|nr:MAG: hypothetical protein AUJ24_01160 [Parcubacteria group bacterium CG1_02_36_42]PIY90832.1 MAG: hypothetical protein COY72_01415 [Candidatus Nealsonbacteria bacterium CG_4_10_14_0_8_um_filter_35_10]PJB99743.1 MAG: hypothetical protein CO077_00140 [Candidatus Nealsonbacteria bacterium CG_4_9_14_0_8_um_filter_35_12]
MGPYFQFTKKFKFCKTENVCLSDKINKNEADEKPASSLRIDNWSFFFCQMSNKGRKERRTVLRYS